MNDWSSNRRTPVDYAALNRAIMERAEQQAQKAKRFAQLLAKCSECNWMLHYTDESKQYIKCVNNQCMMHAKRFYAPQIELIEAPLPVQDEPG